MEKYLDAFINSFLGTVNWTYKSIIFEVPWYTNYFWGLIIISLIVWGLEIAFPWRKNQAIISWMLFICFSTFLCLLLLLADFIKY